MDGVGEDGIKAGRAMRSAQTLREKCRDPKTDKENERKTETQRLYSCCHYT